MKRLFLLCFISSFTFVNSLSGESLWRDDRCLFVDRKACKPGDIVMVVVAESSTATHTTTTEREKEVKLSGGPTGGGENLLDFLPSFGANSKTEYKGEGVTVRTGDLIGKIACKIIRVLPNGNLSIKGERKVRVNNDEELMILTGVIRPDDIRPDNTILSYYVSDVNIRFRGGTSITDEERPGLFHRVFSGIWDIIF